MMNVVLKMALVIALTTSCSNEGKSPSKDTPNKSSSSSSGKDETSEDATNEESESTNSDETQASRNICRMIPKTFSTLETSLSNPGIETTRKSSCKIDLKESESNEISSYTCVHLNLNTFESTSESFFYESSELFIDDFNFLKAFKIEVIDETNQKTTKIFLHDFRNQRILTYKTFHENADQFEEIASALTDGWNIDLMPISVTESSASCDKTITFEYNDDKLLVKYKEASSDSCQNPYIFERMIEYNDKNLITRVLESRIENPGQEIENSTVQRFNYSYDELEKICMQVNR